MVTKGEPFLTKHKVNYSTKDHANADTLTLATKWLVHFCDGYNSLNFISKKSKIKVSILKKSLEELNKRGLIRYK